MLRRGLFWTSLGAIGWAHAGYPPASGLAARIRPRPVAKDDILPTVSVIVAAHDEEAVIGRRVENLLELDYPPERVEIVVASDASSGRDGRDRRGDRDGGAACPARSAARAAAR